MVLRFNCPCGAPYALADHLAGRTFKCTQCQRTLKVGTPAPPPQQDGLMASMEWSSEQQAPNMNRGAAPAAPLDLAPEPGPPPQQQQQQRPGKSSSDRHLANVGERAKKRRRPSSASGKLGRSSAPNRKAMRRSSAAGRVPDPARHSKECHLCGEVIAKIAKECPNCGANVHEPSGAEVAMEKAKTIAGPAILVVGVLGAVAFGVSMFSKDEVKPRGGGVRVGQADGDSDGDGDDGDDDGARDGDSDGRSDGDSDGRSDGSGDGDSDGSGDGDSDGSSDGASDGDSDGDTDGSGDGGDDGLRAVGGGGQARPIARETTIHIPPGPLQAGFIKLRDAEPGPDVAAAITELAGQKGAAAAAAQAVESSLDNTYKLRAHRLRLLAGTDEERREAIAASLKDNTDLFLALAALTGLELDRQEFGPKLRQLPFKPESMLARCLGDAVLSNQAPSDSACSHLQRSFERCEPGPLKDLCVALLVFGGYGQHLEAAALALESSSEPVKELAAKALQTISGGFGPGPDADPAAWQEWAQAYAPKREVLAAACVRYVRGKTQPKDISAAKRRAIEMGSELLEVLPIYLSEANSRNVETSRAVGDIVARSATAEDLAAVTAILKVLGQPHGDHGGAEIVRGALLALDADIAGPAIEALIRMGPPVGDRNLRMPILLRPAEADDVFPLRTYVEGLPDKLQAEGRLFVAGFRSKDLDELVLGDKLGLNQRAAMAAILGSSKVEKAYLEAIDGGDPLPEVAGPNKAIQVLSGFGTSAVVPKLVKRFNDTPSPHLARALQRLAGPADVRKLKKSVKDISGGGVASPLFRTLEEVGGDAARKALERRIKDKEDPLRKMALKSLMAMGSQGARDSAVEPFEKWKASDYKRGMPGKTAVENLVRCGKPEDGQWLAKMFEQDHRRLGGIRLPALMGIGILKHKPGAYVVSGFVFRGHALRDSAAVSLALMEADGAAERIAGCLQASEGSASTADTVLVAALATLDTEQAVRFAKELMPDVMKRGEGLSASALAFAFALSGDEDSLDLLANHSIPAVRAGTARGIAWASLTTAGMTAPRCLADLRFDIDPWVQLEAAICAGYLRTADCLPDVARALTLPEVILGSKRPGPPSLATLAGTEGILTSRHALWEAYEANAKTDGLTYRKVLSLGRVYEREREVRAKARK